MKTRFQPNEYYKDKKGNYEKRKAFGITVAIYPAFKRHTRSNGKKKTAVGKAQLVMRTTYNEYQIEGRELKLLAENILKLLRQKP